MLYVCTYPFPRAFGVLRSPIHIRFPPSPPPFLPSKIRPHPKSNLTRHGTIRTTLPTPKSQKRGNGNEKEVGKETQGERGRCWPYVHIHFPMHTVPSDLKSLPFPPSSPQSPPPPHLTPHGIIRPTPPPNAMRFTKLGKKPKSQRGE